MAKRGRPMGSRSTREVQYSSKPEDVKTQNMEGEALDMVELADGSSVSKYESVCMELRNCYRALRSLSRNHEQSGVNLQFGSEHCKLEGYRHPVPWVRWYKLVVMGEGDISNSNVEVRYRVGEHNPYKAKVRIRSGRPLHEFASRNPGKMTIAAEVSKNFTISELRQILTFVKQAPEGDK